MASIKEQLTLCSNSLDKLNIILEFLLSNKEDNTAIFSSKIARATNLYDTVQNIYLKIDASKLNKPDREKLLEVNSCIDDVYDNIQAFSFRPDVKPVLTVSSEISSNIRLPQLKIKPFTGNVTDFPEFISMFRALIEKNTSLSSIEKLQYLVAYLDQEPLTLIKHLPLHENNYKIAIDILVDRYENKRILISTYWNKMFSANKVNVTSMSASSLRTLINTFSENIAALVPYNINLWDFTLLQTLLQKIDAKTRTQFEVQHASKEIPCFQDLLAFLTNQCKALESVSSFQQAPIDNAFIKKPSSRPPFHTKEKSSFVTNSNELQCPVCNSDHRIFKCDSFLSKSPKERYTFAKENKLCVNCLTSHSFNKCSSKTFCHVCSKPHHTLLHFGNSSNNTDNFKTSATSSGSDETPRVVTSAVVATNTVLLSTALVSVCDSKGNYHTCRALIDSGSQSSFITEKCLNRLGLRTYPSSISIQGIGQVTASTSNHTAVCCIKPRSISRRTFHVEAVVVPTICGKIPSFSFSSQACKHFQHLPLADPDYGKAREIDILLGSEIYSRIMRPAIKFGSPDQPTAMKTVFGWVLSGKTSAAASCFRNRTALCSSVIEIDNTLKRFWELESIPDQNVLSPDDLHCEDVYKRTVARDDSGRYTVSLPFREPTPQLGNSRVTAMRRLLSLENKFFKIPSLRQEYDAFMHDYLDSGHMSLVASTDAVGKYYIPHHPVFKPDSTTTKTRVVFDASCKTSTAHSLNDILLTGPKLQQDLPSLLLRFRIHAVVMIADIKQMYRQIQIAPEHRRFQRILWRFNPDTPVQEFELNTVTYGVNCSPFLAIRTLLKLASDAQQVFPLASSVLSKDTYVDDVVTGCPSVEDALILQTQLLELLKSGGFDLRKWSSNNHAVIDALPLPLRQNQSQSFDTSDNNFIKVLGLKWNPSTDCFTYHVEAIERPCTKRTILSEIARIFDPLGFLAPLTLFAKHLVQLLWTQGIDWDAPPSQLICDQWSQYKAELSVLADLQVPRRVLVNNMSCDLHGFCDASEIGYAAVVYFRILHSDNSVTIHLVSAKSKVSPLKRVSIPRLELCAALLLANLTDFVSHTYKNIIQFRNIFAWSDSTVVLAWIQSSPHQWKTFVSNRVTLIQEKLPPHCWLHVRSSDNPADCASRGLLPKELLNHSLYWFGPNWLLSPSDQWPSSCLDTPVTDLELKVVAMPTQTGTHFLDEILLRCSSLHMIQRNIAYLSRFTHYIRNKLTTPQGSLTNHELRHALLHLVKYVQHVVFSKEISLITDHLPCSKPIRKLTPFLDESGFLRVGGRLRHSKLSFSGKHPMLLPADHRLTELIVEHFHVKYLHAGPSSTQYLLAQQFWVLSSKRAVNRCISKCHKCFRIKPVPYPQPLMGDLPPPRVSEVKPFLHTGVDFGGPFFITHSKRRGVKTSKAYLCLFVCMSVKALHLELVSDLTSDAFLAAFRRFVARRGHCQHMYSDRGTNFVGANKQLSKLAQTAAAGVSIQWHFNPPAASHMGGLWESGIKSVKYHLRRVIGDQILTYEELNTVFNQIEAVLNSRPLYALSGSPDDPQALTPGHFLTLAPLTAPLDEDLIKTASNRLSRWQLLQKLHQNFWKRWHQEYLHTLQQRHKWNSVTSPPSVGTVVVIKQENISPLSWPLGLITHLHRGVDGHVRIVTVRTSKGSLTRPVGKLCPLPMYDQ